MIRETCLMQDLVDVAHCVARGKLHPPAHATPIGCRMDLQATRTAEDTGPVFTVLALGLMCLSHIGHSPCQIDLQAIIYMIV